MTTVELNVLRWGPGDGPRVLLLHGVQSSAATWWRVADELGAAGCSVTAPDLRGHGASPAALRYRLADFTADLLRLGERWDLVAGHSLGATVAAHALSAAPGLARAAVLLDPPFDLPDDDEAFDALVARQLRELATADAAALQAEHPGWHPEDCRLKALAARACSPYVNEAVLRDNRPWDHGHLLAGVAVPVTILVADPAAGGMLGPARAAALADGNPRVATRRLAGVSHSIQRDRPDLVIDAILGEMD